MNIKMQMIVLVAMFIVAASAPAPVLADRLNCGVVEITRVLSGPRHGAMMQVSPSCPGVSDWVCLDPNGQYMSIEASRRLFSQVLGFHLAGKKIQLAIDEGVYADACGGGYSIVNDVRTP